MSSKNDRAISRSNTSTRREEEEAPMASMQSSNNSTDQGFETVAQVVDPETENRRIEELLTGREQQVRAEMGVQVATARSTAKAARRAVEDHQAEQVMEKRNRPFGSSKTSKTICYGVLCLLLVGGAVVGALVASGAFDSASQMPDRNCCDASWQVSSEVKSWFGDSDAASDRLTVESQYGPIESWCFNVGVTSFEGIFFDRTTFNENISKWDTSNVFNMKDIFYRATIFDQDIDNWDVSKVTDLNQMFREAKAFIQS